VAPGLERVVRHCLEKNPEERFQSARDLAFDLEALSDVSAPAALPAARSAPRRRLRFFLLIAAAVMVAALAGVFLSRRPRVPAGIDSLAVLPFTNASRDPNADYLSDGISESLIHSLSQLPRPRLTAPPV